ncbi:MAG: glycoside hydrolase family 127 protein [Prevotella sp.]|nr:glycoside hydrolase family 127 protein [Prevotella sp.]
MRTIKTIALAFIAFHLSLFTSVAQTFVVEHPITSAQSANYVNSRAPLRQQCFIKLPVGSIRPAGWIGRYLQLQRDGLTGHLGEISAWLEKDNNAWLTTGGDHGWEEVPYWLKGYSDLAYILGDEQMIAETRTWIEATFKSQREDGFFGPANFSGGKPELWAQMIMLSTLQTYYEYTQDKRVIDLMTRYFKWELALPDDQFLESYWENSRGGDNLYTVLWLYNRTGEEFLIDLAHKIHRNTADWCQETALPNWHNVNVAQCFREPATYWMLTGDEQHLKASYNDQQLIRRIYGQVPGGMFGGDENCRMGYIDPRQGVETCGMVEQMASDEIMLRFTGDSYWADNCEDVAFNTYPAATMPDFKALRYITSPNMVQSDSKNHAPGIQNNGPFLSMNPFSSRCCQHNHSQGWPYYSENLVYATPDNGVAFVLYGACEAQLKVGQGEALTVKEDTHYPFNDQIDLTLQLKKKVSFPLYLRIPTWAQGASVKINGKLEPVALERGKYVCINRQWKNGDRVTLALPMSLGLRQWTANKNSVSVDYGPLTLSLKIKERYVTRDSKETAIGDSKWQKNADASQWPTTEIYADSPWNYALYLPGGELKIDRVRKAWPADDFPFTLDSTPISFRAKGRLVPSWTMDKYDLCGILPEPTAAKSAELYDIELVPMGAARLRISAFPVAKE